MPIPSLPRAACAPALLLGSLLIGSLGAQEPWSPEIPRTWDEQELADFELPLARPEYSPEHVSSDYYYALPVRTIWRSYPVYHPDREPEGYLEQLRRAEPAPEFDPELLHTRQDWIAAGRRVFHAPVDFDGPIITPEQVRDPEWLARYDVRATTDGVLPFVRWVVRERGRVELGNLSCAMCHTRVLDDGRLVEGAQSDFPFDEPFAEVLRGEVPEPILRGVVGALVDTPWTTVRPSRTAPMEELAEAFATVPRGAMIRQGTGLDAPAKVPDLIGIRDRRYLDASGLVRHRGIGDLMRYAAANQGMDMLARYGDLVPESGSERRPAPGEGRFSGTAARYSDEQLFALATFLYSLEPPANPNPFDDLARRGREVFEAESCKDCHPAPVYTNNELVPAPGFRPPAEHFERYDISKRRVRTDPALTMSTRRGTGYYRVPSLRGVWYRGSFGHSGSVASLEEWFDPTRETRGHRFGRELEPDDKRSLLAFLRTL